MDELLSCQNEQQQVMNTAHVIEQLVSYYHNVAVTLRQFSERYNKIKKRVIERNRLGNSQDALRRLHEKANDVIKKEMTAYTLVKEIESLLSKRERRMTEGLTF